MLVQLTSLKDGIDGETFQITRATHTVSSSNGYECELDLIATRDSTGAYEAKIAPTLSSLGAQLGASRRAQRDALLNTLQSKWI